MCARGGFPTVRWGIKGRVRYNTSVGLQEPENAMAQLVRVELRKRGMAQKSQLEWTDATWNPVTGCTKIGP